MARHRPVDLVSPSSVAVDLADPAAARHPLPSPAPYVAVEAETAGPAALVLEVAGTVVRAHCAEGRTWLRLDGPWGGSRHESRRSGAVGPEGVDAVGLVLTGAQVTLLTRHDGRWTGRATVDLAEVDAPTAARVREPEALAGLVVGHEGAATRLRAGGFGQLGLRDVRLVTHADGTAYRRGPGVWLSATSAGPGFFATAHTSVWHLDTRTLALTHAADLFFTRPGDRAVHGDHATHLVRDGGRWLVATSTWGDFHRERHPHVEVVLARSDADLLTGRHVLATTPLALPTDGFSSVGVWDPHLVRDADRWLVGYVSARRFFAFHPVVAEGPSLDDLRVRAAATRRRATEGTTLHRGPDGGWRVLASDGRDGRRGARERYPVLDLDLADVGALAAPYPSNIPWPTLVPGEDGAALLVTFDGRRTGGRVLGYGTHGDLVVLRGS